MLSLFSFSSFPFLLFPLSFPKCPPKFLFSSSCNHVRHTLCLLRIRFHLTYSSNPFVSFTRLFFYIFRISRAIMSHHIYTFSILSLALYPRIFFFFFFHRDISVLPGFGILFGDPSSRSTKLIAHSRLIRLRIPDFSNSILSDLYLSNYCFMILNYFCLPSDLSRSTRLMVPDTSICSYLE